MSWGIPKWSVPLGASDQGLYITFTMVRGRREGNPVNKLQSWNPCFHLCPSVPSLCLGKHCCLFAFSLFPVAKSFLLPHIKKDLKSGRENHLQASEEGCYGSQKVFVVTKLLPLGGQVVKEYKVLVQLGKAIFLTCCGVVTGLEEKLEKEKSGADEGEFTSTPADS